MSKFDTFHPEMISISALLQKSTNSESKTSSWSYILKITSSRLFLKVEFSSYRKAKT